MIPQFLWLAGLAGLGVALVAGPLGCFVIWRRMAFFGDTLAHGALLGVALALASDLAIPLGILAVAAAITATVLLARRQRRLAADTLLAIMSHSGLALGLVALSLLGGGADLEAYLFGDILAVAPRDIAFIWVGAAVALAALAAVWRALLVATVNDELARAEGLKTAWAELILMLTLALLVALAIKVVGVLLITALLIVPAAAARRFAATPEAMAAGAALAGCLAVIGGLAASLAWDTPAGPSIVVAALALFIGVQGVGILREQWVR